MSLNFVREPDNKYDKNAIGVWCDNQQIGHLPKYLAARIAPLMDEGATIEGKIDQITGGNGKSYGCNIEYVIHK